MIKLINILSEIKLISRITPQTIHKIYWELWKKADNIEEEEELKALKIKCFNRPFTVEGSIIPSEMLYASDQQLKCFYKELFNFKQKYNL